MAIRFNKPFVNEQPSFLKRLIGHENFDSLLSVSDKKSVSYKKSNKIVTLTDKHVRAMKNGIKKEVKSLVNHLIFKGNLKLVAQVKYFKTELVYHNDLSKLVYDINKKYSSTLHMYSENLLNDANPVYEVDKQYVMLDLIETASQILLNDCRVILNTIQRNQTGLLNKYKGYKAKIVYLLESLQQYIHEVKNEEIAYICEQYDICRKFPAYSDFITDLIKEILIIPDVKLNYLIKDLKLLFNEQYNFIEEVLNEKLAAIVSNKLKTLFNNNMTKVKNTLDELRKILMNRHKMIRSKDEKVVKKARAVTMLIDIVDKAFDKSDEEMLVIYMDNTSTALRKWAAWENNDQDLDMSRSLGNFVRYFADNIAYSWKLEAREEVRVLLEIILTGNATNKNIYENLFTKGSRYLNSKPGYDLNTSL